MKYFVEFSSTAKIELNAIENYIFSEFGLSAQESFVKKLEKSLMHLSRFPFSYPESKIKEGLRKVVVTEYTIMLFEIVNDCVQIAAVFDGWRDYDSIDI